MEKNYIKKNAKYRGIPCYFNVINNEIIGKNFFYEFLINIIIWFDINIFMVSEFPIWIEVDKLEK